MNNIKRQTAFSKATPKEVRRNDFIEDGEDHINISVHGNTKLGRDLSIDAPVGFNHPTFGSFTSVRGFWYYIKLGVNFDDRLRRVSGDAAHSLYYKIVNHNNKKKIEPRTHIKNFKAIMIEACYLKIIQNKKLEDEVFNNILALDCYTELRSGIRTWPNYAPWFIHGMRYIFDHIQRGKTPDFTNILDATCAKENMYQDVLPGYLLAKYEKENISEIDALEAHLRKTQQENQPDEKTNISELNAKPVTNLEPDVQWLPISTEAHLEKTQQENQLLNEKQDQNELQSAYETPSLSD